jgi:hypothetical protein
LNDPRVVVHVIWEPVLASDSGAPIEQTLARVGVPNTAQFWDPDRQLSKAMGEKAGDRKSIVWDYVAVYSPDTRWQGAPPKPVWSGRPVVKVTNALEAAIKDLDHRKVVP